MRERLRSGPLLQELRLDKEEKGDTALPRVKVAPLLALCGGKLNATLRQRHGCGRPPGTHLAGSLSTEVRA